MLPTELLCAAIKVVFLAAFTGVMDSKDRPRSGLLDITYVCIIAPIIAFELIKI